MTDRCFYFGCWKQPGHYLFAPGGEKVWDDAICFFAQRRQGSSRYHIDGNLAPRVHRSNKIISGWTVDDGQQDGSAECLQGLYLCHELPNGFTAVAWWDRNQGDRRGNCSSTILLEGKHTAEEVLRAGREHFPHVFDNLKRAGIALVEVHLS